MQRPAPANHPPRRLALPGALACVLFVALLTWSYVSREDNAYYWDYRDYWQLAQDSLSAVRLAPGSWLVEVLRSIWSEAYNYAFTVPLLPFLALLGPGRLPYIEGLALLFMLPVMLLARVRVSAAIAPGADAGPATVEPWLATLWILLYLPFWIPTLRGLPDVVGLLPLIAASQLLLSGSLLRQGWRDLLRLALLLYLPILLRKWYGFAVIAMYGCGYPYSLWLARHADNRQGISPLALTRRWLTLGGLVLLLVCTFQGGMLLALPAAPPTQAYAAYQISPSGHVLHALDYFGLPVLLTALLGGVAALRKPRALGPAAAYHAGCIALTLFLFTRVQGLDIQHYLPIAWFLLPLSLGGIALLGELPGKSALAGALALLASAGFASNLGYLPGNALAMLVPPDRHPPLRYPAGNDYAGLLQDIGALTSGTDQTVAIFASSPRLSYSLLCQMATPALAPHLVPTAEIDSRDQLYAPALLTDYAVVANPVQVHRAATDQQVIVVPNQQILTGTGIGAAYRPIGRHALGDGTYALIFRKTRPFQPAEIDSLFGALLARYPQWRPAYDLRLRAFLASGARLATTPGRTRPGTAHLVLAPPP